MLRSLSGLFQDFRFGLRILRRSPVFTMVAVSSLALGIGGAAAVFSLLNAIVLRNLPVTEPDRLFTAVRHLADDRSPRFSWPSVQRLRDDLAGRAEIAASSSLNVMQLRPAGTPAGASAERGVVQLVSGEYFALLGQRPYAGRLLTPADNQVLDGHPVAVVSHGYWQRALEGKPDVVGQPLTINGTTFSIVGIAGPGFFGTTLAIRGVEVWVPLVMQHTVRYGSNASSFGSGDTRKPWAPQQEVEWLNLFLRVPPGVEAGAIAEAITVRERADAASQSGSDERRQSVRISLEPAGRGISSIRDAASTTLYVLLAMMVVLLVIASGNVAGLLAARSTAREREVALRLSLGARRGRLVRQLLVESLLLGVAGGALGLALAFWGRDLVLRLIAGQTAIVTMDVGIDWRVPTFALVTAVTTGLACGVLPAFRGTRVPLADSLKSQSRAVGLAGRQPLVVGRLLVAAQMAFCLLLLVVAGLFVRSLRSLTASEIGFDRQVLGARLDTRSLGYSPDERLVLYQRIIDRVRALPGVESVSMSLNGPVITSSQISGFSIQGYTPRPGERLSTNEEVVTEGYFSTVGLRVVRGRVFGVEDRNPASRSTLINETMARRYWAAQDPIGRQWAYDARDLGSPRAFVVIGVVEDAKYRDLKGPVPTMTYHLSGPREDAVLSDLEVRTAGAPVAMIASVRKAIAEVEPALPVYDVLPIEGRVTRLLSQDAVVAQLTTLFGGISLLLACLGLYGTISYGVNQRVAELGLRIALGAERRQVQWLVMREAVALVAIGAAAGLPLTYAASRSLGTLLHGIGPLDPLAYGAGAALLVVVALLAAFIPAVRASRIEPIVAIARA